jgi:hypothetical protein
MQDLFVLTLTARDLLYIFRFEKLDWQIIYLSIWHGYTYQGPWHWYPWSLFGLRPKEIMAQYRSRRIMYLNKEIVIGTNITLWICIELDQDPDT